MGGVGDGRGGVLRWDGIDGFSRMRLSRAMRTATMVDDPMKTRRVDGLSILKNGMRTIGTDVSLFTPCSGCLRYPGCPA